MKLRARLYMGVKEFNRALDGKDAIITAQLSLSKTYIPVDIDVTEVTLKPYVSIPHSFHITREQLLTGTVRLSTSQQALAEWFAKKTIIVRADTQTTYPFVTMRCDLKHVTITQDPSIAHHYHVTMNPPATST